MLLDELYAHYGTYAELARRLNLGSTTYQRWKRIGYIPFNSQLVIQHSTDGMFKASKEHGEPQKKRAG